MSLISLSCVLVLMVFLIRGNSTILYLLCGWFVAAYLQEKVDLQLNAISCKFSYKALYPDGLTDANEHNFKILYFKNCTLYEVPEVKLEIFDTIQENGTIINKVKPVDTVYSYFVVKNGQTKGLEYQEIRKGAGRIFSLDSLLTALSIQPSVLEMFAEDLGEPSKIEKHKNVLKETYFFKDEDKGPHTILRFYDKKLKCIPFSFSPALDKEKNSKLIKITFIYNGNKDVHEPLKEITKSIELIKLKDINYFIDIFNSFEKDSKELLLR